MLCNARYFYITQKQRERMQEGDVPDLRKNILCSPSRTNSIVSHSLPQKIEHDTTLQLM